MLALRRLATAVCQASTWNKMIHGHSRCLSLSSYTLKKFPTTSQVRPKEQIVVYLPSDRKEVTMDELLRMMNLGRKNGIIGSLLIDAGVQLNVQDPLKTIIPIDVAELLVLECNMVPLYRSPSAEQRPETKQTQAQQGELKLRPPVVTIMGHVDHGKTTLLDYLRNTAIAKNEAGGITQHVGAFSVKLKDDKRITFIDTPGHAAFNNMRARGAYVTDIVVLVIAADDGVKAQTVESLKYILPENIPVIVALNKIDKPNINLEAVKSQLLGYGLFLEEVGGDVQCVEISALKGTNIPSLIEAVLAQAEVTPGLNVSFAGPSQGIILESRMDSKIGPVATVIVGQGTLRVGSFVTAGNTWAKVKALKDWENKAVKSATPSMPVLVTGWKDVPCAGDAVVEVATKEAAMKETEERKSSMGIATSHTIDLKPVTSRNLEILETIRYKKQTNQSLELHPKLKYNDENRVDLVIKGDTTGSVEAVLEALKTFQSDQVILSVLHAGVGNVTESDVTTVAAFKGTILAFNVKALKAVQKLAATSEVTIKQYDVIYTLLDELKETIAAKLPPVRVDTEKGRAVVLQKFKLTGSRKSVVAGCNVKSGVLKKGDSFKVLRYNKTIYEGKLSAMKRGVEDTNSVSSGTDCGLEFEDFSDFDQGDNIVCFTSEYVKQELDWEFGF